MKKIIKGYIGNKKVKYDTNKKSILNVLLASILKINLAAALSLMLMAVIVNAGDVSVQTGDIFTEKNNELFLSLKNTEAGGHDYRLVSAGSVGGIGVGKFGIYDATAGLSRLTIDSDGNVGIGTTARFISSGRMALGTTLSTANLDTGLRITGSANTGETYFILANTHTGSNAGFFIQQAFADSASTETAAELIQSAKSGAWTSDASTKDTATKIYAIRDNVGRVYISADANTDTLKLRTSNADALTIDSLGNVGIGTTSPTQKLHVVGSQNLTGTLFYGALQAQSPHALIQKDANGNLKPTEFCIISNENNVLSLTFNDGFIPTIGINSTSCMNKEILVEINSSYALNSTTNQTYLESQYEIREKVFTGERRTNRVK